MWAKENWARKREWTINPNARFLLQKVKVIFESAIAQLKEEDRDLLQIRLLLPLLQRGVGIHHSGLLLILKEVCYRTIMVPVLDFK